MAAVDYLKNLDAICSSISKILIDLNMNMTEKNEICAVCLDDIENKKCELDCGHCFHTACILKCASTQNSCPICRSILFEKFETQKNEEESQTIEIAIIDSENEWINAQRAVKNYDARRNRLARTNTSIHNNREKMKNFKREYQSAEKTFDTDWDLACRHLWNSSEFKKKRADLLNKKRKWKRSESIYNRQTAAILGERPILPDFMTTDNSWMEALASVIDEDM